MIEIIEKVEDMCKRCRDSGTDDEQLMVVRLDELERITDLARKGLVFVDMVNQWIKRAKEEAEDNTRE